MRFNWSACQLIAKLIQNVHDSKNKRRWSAMRNVTWCTLHTTYRLHGWSLQFVSPLIFFFSCLFYNLRPSIRAKKLAASILHAELDSIDIGNGQRLFADVFSDLKVVELKLLHFVTFTTYFPGSLVLFSFHHLPVSTVSNASLRKWRGTKRRKKR